MRTALIEGNPLEPSSADIIAQSVTLAQGEKPDGYDGRNCGWRVLTVYGPTGSTSVVWARVAMRYEIQSLNHRECDECGFSYIVEEDNICDDCATD